MEYLRLKCNTRDIDTKKGIVSFYFANFKTADRNNRIMDRNSFNRTIKGNFSNFVHLLNHNPSAIIGKPLEVATDENGAFMVSQLSKNAAGRDALTMYEEGIYNQHSFGFEIIQSQMDGKIEHVNELRMWEASTVTWAAHPDTPTISLNTIDPELLERIEKIEENINIARLPVETHQTPQQEFEEIINFIKNY